MHISIDNISLFIKDNIRSTDENVKHKMREKRKCVCVWFFFQICAGLVIATTFRNMRRLKEKLNKVI